MSGVCQTAVGGSLLKVEDEGTLNFIVSKSITWNKNLKQIGTKKSEAFLNR